MDSDDEAKLMLSACDDAAEVFVDAFQEEEDTETPKQDHPQEPRSKRLKFNHARAQQCIEQDYLGPTHCMEVSFMFTSELAEVDFNC
jgi:hypothetical protein